LRPRLREARHAALKRARSIVCGMDYGSVDLEFVTGPLLGLAVAMVAMLMMMLA
jgi:hypothetical protein